MYPGTYVSIKRPVALTGKSPLWRRLLNRCACICFFSTLLNSPIGIPDFFNRDPADETETDQLVALGSTEIDEWFLPRIIRVEEFLFVANGPRTLPPTNEGAFWELG